MKKLFLQISTFYVARIKYKEVFEIVFQFLKNIFRLIDIKIFLESFIWNLSFQEIGGKSIRNYPRYLGAPIKMSLGNYLLRERNLLTM